MQQKGFAGVFGLDLVVDKDDKIYVIENNARLVASIPFFTRMQLQEGSLPLALIHLLELTRAPYDFDFGAASATLGQKRQGSQLILRNVFDRSANLEGDFRTGVYTMDLHFQKDGYDVTGINNRRDELLLTTVKTTRQVNPNMEYANLQFRTGISEGEGRLNKQVLQIAGQLQNQFKQKAMHVKSE
jgi:hypothetical protein